MPRYLTILTETSGDVVQDGSEVVEETKEFVDKVIEFSDKPWVQATLFIVGGLVLGALTYQFVIKPIIKKVRKL